MKKHVLLLLVLLWAFAGKAQVNIPYQEINYDVHYHWGLINVMIAHGKVTLQTDGTNFNGTLDGNSIPWEGRIFFVSDTLQAKMTPGPGLSKETVVYENGWYMKPKVGEYRAGGFSPTNPASYKNIKGAGELNASGETMEAITVTADMLGMFYYVREIDFESMQPGHQLTIPINVEGGTPERVNVTYEGKSVYTANGVSYGTYAITFEYSYNGVMSGYPVRCEVSSSERIPVLISANLPIGQVEMIYRE